MAKSESIYRGQGQAITVFVSSRTAPSIPPPSFLEGLLCDKTETIARETRASSSALENFKCVVQYSEGYQIFNPF